jgi:hypothetical protein
LTHEPGLIYTQFKVLNSIRESHILPYELTKMNGSQTRNSSKTHKQRI